MNTPHNFCYSAILTCYNAQETITKALEGILSQSIFPAEIIVVDDCSTDSSIIEIEKFLNHKVPIRIFKNTINMGQSWSRNLAITTATSAFAVIFDDDDYSLPGRAEEHSRLFKLGSVLNFVSSRKLYSNGHNVELSNQDLKLSGITAREALLNILLGNPIKYADSIAIPASTSAISIKEFLEIGGYDNDFRRLEDAELFVRLSNSYNNFAWSSNLLVNRQSTLKDSKGGVIETYFELKLLNKHKDKISRSEYSYAKHLIELRDSYFGKRYAHLLFSILINPFKMKILISKSTRAFRRVFHDIQVGKFK